MSRKHGDGCTFRQRDLKEAIKAARNAGLENFRVDIDKETGRISVVATPGEAAIQGAKTGWDKLLDE